MSMAVVAMVMVTVLFATPRASKEPLQTPYECVSTGPALNFSLVNHAVVIAVVETPAVSCRIKESTGISDGGLAIQ